MASEAHNDAQKKAGPGGTRQGMKSILNALVMLAVFGLFIYLVSQGSLTGG